MQPERSQNHRAKALCAEKPGSSALDRPTVIHDSWKAHSNGKPGEGIDMQFPRFEHPVVGVRPVTLRNVLFVDRGFTALIVQLVLAEGDALLAFFARPRLSAAAAARPPIPASTIRCKGYRARGRATITEETRCSTLNQVGEITANVIYDNGIGADDLSRRRLGLVI